MFEMFNKDESKGRVGVKAPEIDTIKVLPLHGDVQMFSDPTEALAYVTGYTWNDRSKTLVRFEITVYYKNSGSHEGRLPDREMAIEFLKNRQKGVL